MKKIVFLFLLFANLVYSQNCEDIETYSDFGKTFITTPSVSIVGDEPPLIFIKEINFFGIEKYSLTVRLQSRSFRNSDNSLLIMFDNEEYIFRQKVKISFYMYEENRIIEYFCNIMLTNAEVEMLSNYSISYIELGNMDFIFDEEYSIMFKNYINCVLNK